MRTFDDTLNNKLLFYNKHYDKLHINNKKQYTVRNILRS